MGDRGIIFAAPMVRALLDGRKTQTRRLIKPAPYIDAMGNFCAADRKGVVWNWGQNIDGTPCLRSFVKRMPFATGDRLYVREACRAEELVRPPVERPATRRERALMKRTTVIECDELDGRDGVRFLADEHWQPIENTPEAGCAWGKLFHYGNGPAKRMAGLGKGVPPIHMPRWASRLTLTVTDVRVQRLQEISEADAEAEGVERLSMDDEGHFYAGLPEGTFRCGFAGIWSHLHTKPGEAWDDNPWICAVSFDVRHGNIDAESPKCTR